MQCNWSNMTGEVSVIEAELKGTSLLGYEQLAGGFREREWNWCFTEQIGT